MGILLILTQAFHPVILLPLDLGQTACWLLALMAGVLTVLLAWPVSAALRRFPGADLMDLTQTAFGVVGRLLCGVAFCATLVFMAGMTLRETVEAALTTAFPHTPQTFATVGLLGAVTFIAWGGGDGLVRLGRLLLPSLIAALLLVVIWASPWGYFRNLYPLWGPGPLRLAIAAPAVAVEFAPLFLLYLLAGGVRRRKALGLWLLAVPAITGVAFAVIKAVFQIVLPYSIGRAITFPMQVAVRIVSGGRFFERMDGIWLYVWVICTAAMVGALLWGAATTLTRAFVIRRHTTVIPPLAAVILAEAYFTPSQPDTISLHKAAAPFIAAFTLALPAIAALIALLRRRGRKRVA